LCLGYRGDLVRQFFLDYNPYLTTDFTIKQGGTVIEPKHSDIYDWTINCIDTGLHANLGQRLLAVREYIGDDEHFLANYSDQLSDLALNEYISEAVNKNVVGSFVSVKPQQSFHNVQADSDGMVSRLLSIKETSFWVNGGFFVLKNEIFEHIKPGEELVEEPFARLIKSRQLWTHKHHGFWHAMDTFKDKMTLDQMHGLGDTPWVVSDPESSPEKL